MNKSGLLTKNFSLLLLGQASSLFGNIILRFALSMHVLEISGSASVFATLLAVATVPTILLSPFGGMLADRANKRNIMVVLDFLSGATVLLTLLTSSKGLSIAGIGVILVILSVLEAFESPTVQASVPQIHSGDNVVRANAAVNQINAVSRLVAPILGSVLYTMFGIRQVMQVTMVCFFFTALLECFIQLKTIKQEAPKGVFKTIRSDFATSVNFATKQQPAILKILLLIAVINFLLMGVIGVGMPYMVRNILGLDAKYYGAAESIIGFSAIAGSISTSFLVTKIKTRHLYLLMVMLGLAILPMGFAFLFPESILVKYYVLLISNFILQFAACILSIFILSLIQQKTPNHLIGKIMAYGTTISICAQPLGQLVYGVLFDQFSTSLYVILLASGVATCAIGFATRKTFLQLDQENATPQKTEEETILVEEAPEILNI